MDNRSRRTRGKAKAERRHGPRRSGGKFRWMLSKLAKAMPIEDLGVADGQEVEVHVRVLTQTPPRKPGEGFLRTEGALADDAEWDVIMEEIYQARKRDRRPQIPDLGES